MLRYLTAYVCTAAILFPIDLLWINGVARDFYRTELGSILSTRPNIAVAVAFYVIYVIGVVAFVVGPALAQNSWRTALIWGALFGFFAYATYDLTNWATLQNFSGRVAMVDLAWGTFISGLASTFGFFVARWVLARLVEA